MKRINLLRTTVLVLVVWQAAAWLLKLAILPGPLEVARAFWLELT